MRLLEFARISLKPDELLSHNFLKLYGDAYKSLNIQAFQNNEPAFLILQTPLSILYQLYVTLWAKKQDFSSLSLNSQLIQGKHLLADSTFFEDWKLIYSNSDSFLQEILDINPIRLTGLRAAPLDNVMNPPVDSEAESEENMALDMDSLGLYRNPLLGQEPPEEEDMEPEEPEILQIEGGQRDTGEAILGEEEQDSDSEEDINEEAEEEDEEEEEEEEEVGRGRRRWGR